MTRAFRTDSLHEIIACPGIVALGQDHGWYMDVVKAEGPVASLAIEMYVGVLVVIRVVAEAQFVPDSFHAFDGMDEMMLLECVQAAEYSGLVDRPYTVLQLHQAQRPARIVKRLGHQQAVCGNLDSMFHQELLDIGL